MQVLEITNTKDGKSAHQLFMSFWNCIQRSHIELESAWSVPAVEAESTLLIYRMFVHCTKYGWSTVQFLKVQTITLLHCTCTSGSLQMHSSSIWGYPIRDPALSVVRQWMKSSNKNWIPFLSFMWLHSTYFGLNPNPNPAQKSHVLR